MSDEEVEVEDEDRLVFDVDFEEEVIASALASDDYLKTASRILDSHHFGTETHSWVWGVAKENWLKFAERPSAKVFVAHAKRSFRDEAKAKTALELVRKLLKLKPRTPKASLALLNDFVRFVKLQSAMETATKEMERGDLEKAMEAIRNVGRGDIRPKSYEVSKWMEEWDLRQAERKHRSEHPDDFVCVPTGLRSLDEIVKGVQQGELASVLATTNRGKSIFLTHIGYQAILRGFGVLHLSLEMNQFQVATRYDSRFSSIPYKKFKDFTFNEEDQDIIATRLKMSREKLSSKLRIISMPLRRCDINLVRQAVEEAREEMKIDMLIVDSGDHMNSIVKHKDKRLEAAEVYWDLKTIAEEERLAVWTSTQAGKEWATRKASSEAASESYDKARICDMILSLNAPEKKTRSSVVVDEEDDGAKESTPEEEDRPLKPYMELYLAKYRDGEAKLTFPLETDFAKMLFKEAKPSTTGGSFEDD